MTEVLATPRSRGEGRRVLEADTEIRRTRVDQSVGGGLAIRENLHVEPRGLEIALFDCHIQPGVVRVRCPIQGEGNGDGARSWERGTSC